MNKLKLELDTLQVETFDTSVAIRTERGTVHGNFYTQMGTCDARAGTCYYGGTCTNGCPRTRACTI